MTSLLLKRSFWDKITHLFPDNLQSLVDIFPKIIYFLYACIASGIDALQALVRKLAGLDSYYIAGSGDAPKYGDPLSEFLFGIIGIGESAPVYKALNTVFWSLSIFGLIVLLVSTMIAIIKSHYGEDAALTSPWKYIYSAIKAVFSFVLVPLAIIIGLQLSNFVLTTLDNITSGSSSQEVVETMFGSDVAKDEFESRTVGKEQVRVYGNYDFFGQREATRNETFSGMMFKASAYESNRYRNGGFGTNTAIFSGRIFGRSPGYDSSPNKREYLAQQVDFAFSNNLALIESYSYNNLVTEVEDDVRIMGWTDWFSGQCTEIKSFSKFYVSLVWAFYDLWQFNWIVAFAGAFSIFSIMLSIIIGLMSRLFKGVALFLVYPSILGLAPMDNFKAFKSWGTNFMQQILMAIGSIVGINLMLLILPYIQNIKFFGPDLEMINYVVNIVMLVTGLMMAKEFMSIVSGFVGGVDANNVGGDLKGTVASSIGKGATTGLKLTSGLMKAGAGAVGVTAMALPALGAAGKRALRRHGIKQANRANGESTENSHGRAKPPSGGDKDTPPKPIIPGPKVESDDEARQHAKDRGAAAGEAARKKAFAEANGWTVAKDGSYRNHGKFISKKSIAEAEEEAKKDKKLTATMEKAQKDADSRANKAYMRNHKEDVKKEKETQKQIAAQEAEETKKAAAAAAAANPPPAKGSGENSSGSSSGGEGKKSGSEKSDKTTGSEQFIFNRLQNAGKRFLDGFVKAATDIGSGLGLDKVVNNIAKTLNESFTLGGGAFHASKKKAEKEDKSITNQKKLSEVQSKENQAQLTALQDLTREIRAMREDNKGLNRELRADITNNSKKNNPPPAGNK